jgi:hypothetical protein
MNLLVSGCSHSAGSEIEAPRHPGSPERAFGGYLKNLLQFNNYVNLSGPGFSNQWIYHKTIEYLETLENPQDWFVIIGWTNASRMPVYCYEKNEVVHLCPNHLDLSIYGKAVQKAYDHLYGTILPIHTSIQTEHTRIIGMQSILKQLKIPYLFFDSVLSNHEHSNTKLLDLNRYYEFNQRDSTFWRNYQINFWDNSDRWAYHAPESYHQYWASKLAEFITQNNLLTYDQNDAII